MTKKDIKQCLKCIRRHGGCYGICIGRKDNEETRRFLNNLVGGFQRYQGIERNRLPNNYPNKEWWEMR